MIQMVTDERPLLTVRDLCVHFQLAKSHLFDVTKTVYAVDGVSFELRRGQTFGIVGESGCGKSTTALSVLRLVEPTSGVICFNDTDMRSLGPKALRRQRQNMQIIFQDPYSSLNPHCTAGDIVGAPLKIQKIGTREEYRDRIAQLFTLVGLRHDQMRAYPHQFSGGQRQRIGIARALASGPDLIVCDEPVSALDVAIQAQILNLLRRLQETFGLTYLFISHDMAVIQHMCDEISVMYLGKIVERAGKRSLFREPKHPYTKALLSAVPRLRLREKRQIVAVRLKGDPPNPINPPPGCRFHPRCPIAENRCWTEEPPLRDVLADHHVACHLV